MYSYPDKVKRITLNLPQKLLKEAQDYTGLNMTKTIIQGLEVLKRGRAYNLAMKYKGKIKLDIDLDSSRERTR